MSEYKVYGISGTWLSVHLFGLGKDNIFGFPYCQNDRIWRKMLAITPDRYQKAIEQQFDECNNAFMKPKRPVFLNDMLEHLHKKSDFSQAEWNKSTASKMLGQNPLK